MELSPRLVHPTRNHSGSSSTSSSDSPQVSFSSTTTSSSESADSASAPVPVKPKPRRQDTSDALLSIYSMYTDDPLPTIKLDYRQSYMSNGTTGDNSELAYVDPPIIDLTGNTTSIIPGTVNGTKDHRRRSTGQSTTALSVSEESSYSTSRLSRLSKSVELPPIPVSEIPTTPRISELLVVPPSSASSHIPSSPPLPLKHPAYTASPSSKTSLVPSENEDMDSFHVRKTYAELEVTGIKGDGYAEGVERTRARIGDSRASQLNVEASVGDGTEKSQELDPREAAILAVVDRYGFFSTPSHDRLMLLPSAPLLRRLAVVPAGPKNAPTSGTALKSLPPPQPLLKESSRISKWERMLRPQKPDPAGILIWSVKPAKEGKLGERTYKGIPDRWRNAAWELLLSRFTSSHAGFSDQTNLSLTRLTEDYRDVLDKPSSYDIQIDLDVPRTISGHIMFKTRYGAGQRSLFHVLHCFSLRCEKCGYVQGMGPIAATLLCYFTPEQVYASLVRLHDAYGMHDIFAPGFPGLLEAIYIQERILEQMLPGVYKAFKAHMISSTSYATKWYITLFSNSVPFQTQLRLWDAFLLDGEDVFIIVAVAIVWVFRDQITSATANFETILSLLSSSFVPEDENMLLSWIEKTLSDKKLRSSMAQWRMDWKVLVASGKDGDALL